MLLTKLILLDGASKCWPYQERVFTSWKPPTTLGRMPHSVIGSTSIGATIVGGIANNAGGAPANAAHHIELSLFAQVDATESSSCRPPRHPKPRKDS